MGVNFVVISDPSTHRYKEKVWRISAWLQWFSFFSKKEAFGNILIVIFSNFLLEFDEWPAVSEGDWFIKERLILQYCITGESVGLGTFLTKQPSSHLNNREIGKSRKHQTK